MVVTVRLDPESERALRRLTRERGTTRSRIIRQAIARLVSEEREHAERAPYQLMSDLVGRVRGGPPDLSSRTGRRFSELLAERKRLKATGPRPGKRRKKVR